MMLTGLGIHAIARAKSIEFRINVEKLWNVVQSKVIDEEFPLLRQQDTISGYIQAIFQAVDDIPVALIESFPCIVSDLLRLFFIIVCSSLVQQRLFQGTIF